MSTEYIRAVSIRRGQVYLTSKSSNDDVPYHAWHCESLSKVYGEEGQPGLDREILRMLFTRALSDTAMRWRRLRKRKSSKRQPRRSRRRMICSRARIRHTRSQRNPRRPVLIG